MAVTRNADLLEAPQLLEFEVAARLRARIKELKGFPELVVAVPTPDEVDGRPKYERRKPSSPPRPGGSLKK